MNAPMHAGSGWRDAENAPQVPPVSSALSNRVWRLNRLKISHLRLRPEEGVSDAGQTLSSAGRASNFRTKPLGLESLPIGSAPLLARRVQWGDPRPAILQGDIYE